MFGRQEVEPNKECLGRIGSIAHEIGHVLGFWHEHQLPDRDEFVQVVYENIAEKYHHLFSLFSVANIGSLNSAYDYGSIMHYNPYAFAINKGQPTVRLLKEYDGEVAQRNHISDADRTQVFVFCC